MVTTGHFIQGELRVLQLTLCLVLIFFGAFSLSAQPETMADAKMNWILFVPEDRSFEIELPFEPEKKPKFFEGENDETIYFRCTKRLEGSYEILFESPTRRRVFKIGVFDTSKCTRRKSDLRKDVKTLSKEYLGGGKGSVVLKDENRTLNDAKARLIVTQTKADNYLWSLFVETRTRVYWIAYTTRIKETQNEGERILNSFKPRT